MSANEMQVGGSHYKTKDGRPEHWDLAIIYRWDPFQYQITKYVMRWKDKHNTKEKRLEDLKKARHFLDKYIENYEVYDNFVPVPAPTPQVDDVLVPVLASSLPGIHENEFWQCEGYYGDGTQLYRCRKCREILRVANLDNAMFLHGICPGSAYVNQG